MERLFSHAPEVVSRTMQFAERCNAQAATRWTIRFPEFAVPRGHTIDSYFEQVCREGLKKRLETAIAHLETRGLLRKPIARISRRG